MAHLLNSKLIAAGELLVPRPGSDWRFPGLPNFHAQAILYRVAMRKLRCAWRWWFWERPSALAQSGPAQSSSIRTSGFTVVETLAVDATEAPRKVFMRG